MALQKNIVMDGNVHTSKALLVAKGFTQTYRVDYEELLSPIADIRAIRILIAIIAFYNYEIWQMNVKGAFLNGHHSEEVYMVQPEVFFNPKHRNQNNKDMFLVYGGDIKQELMVACYIDVGYPTDVDDLKSQTGYIFVFNGGVVN
nr:putative zinc finger, CCHC-type [Tanacetum cinerariifolium]